MGNQKNAPLRRDEAEIAVIMGNANMHPSELLPMLEAIQELLGYLPIDILKKIGESVNLPLSKVMEAASFYKHFRFQPCGQYLIRMCESAPCHLNGSAQTLCALQNALHIRPGETTPDHKFTLELAGCLGVCDRAPAIMVNGEIYGPIHANEVEDFLRQFQ